MAHSIISIMNQKGGTGKTTTTVNLGCALTKLGKRVLLIDLDPQGSLTFYLGLVGLEHTIADAIYGDVPLRDIMLEAEGMTVIPANISLANVELSMSKMERQRSEVLKDLVQEIAEEFDVILIDCSPSLSTLTVNALAFSRQVLIPIQLEVLGVKAIELISDTVFEIKETLNSDLTIMGLLPVMVDRRRKVTDEILAYIKQNFGLRIFETVIKTDVKAVEAPSFGKTILAYAPDSKSAKGYMALAEEIIDEL